MASGTVVAGGTPPGVKRISVGTDVGSLSHPLGTQRSLGWIQDSCLCTAHADPNQLWLQWSSSGLTTEQNVIHSVPDSRCPVCGARLEPALPGSWCCGAAQPFLSLTGSTKLAVLLTACPATASPAPALRVAAGQPCPARHLLAHGSSVLLQLVLPAQARTRLLLWPGKLGKYKTKSRWRMQMRLQLRDQNLGCWKPPSPATIFH